MKREKLILMNYVDGTNDVPFHDADNPIEITEYTFTSKRMGSSTISATLMYPECLDKEWDGRQYVMFGGERYFLGSAPSSSKDNEDTRYSHTLNFEAERDLVLNNVYFYDAVSEESTGDDRYKSNSTKVVFFGDIHEFVARLNESLRYSGVGYSAVVDEGITSEGQLMSFEDKFFFEVLQEIFNVYELPFYFVGKVIHIGFTSNAITHTFRYGFENELLSINKNNANYKVVTRCTGTGSGDNIPYYYPNPTPKGIIGIELGRDNTGLTDESQVTISDYMKYYGNVPLGGVLRYNVPASEIESMTSQRLGYLVSDESASGYDSGSYISVHVPTTGSYGTPEEVLAERRKMKIILTVKVLSQKPEYRKLRIMASYQMDASHYKATMSQTYSVEATDGIEIRNDGLNSSGELEFFVKEAGEHVFTVNVLIWYSSLTMSNVSPAKYFYYDVAFDISLDNTMSGWVLDEEKEMSPEDAGLEINGTPADGDTITQVKIKYITPSDVLLPPIYRETDGAERFYNAVNDTYVDPETGEKYVFENEYVKFAPKEQIVEFEDIKPTIEGTENASGQRIDQILDIAFDEDDNDDVDEEGNYLHPYFFVKLAKFDGDWGFNLFEQAIEDSEMTLAMTSGDCGACEFKITVGEDTQKNLVQVDEDGNLLRDENGNVRCGRPGNVPEAETPQDRQNDTSANEVWLALEKDTSTYGQIMPNALQGIRPKAGDSFVLLNIKMPDTYVYRAEDRLKEEIIRYMAENNVDKFNFSIDFSRIYLAENPDIASQINENARIQLEYDGVMSEFYISQYTYKCVDSEALPEVQIELNETISVSKNTLQTTIDSVQQDVQNRIANIDFLKMGLRYFLRKDVDDESTGKPVFLSGAEFGKYRSGILGSGAAVTVGSDNSTKIEVDYLSVRRRADFTTISVQELKQIGGQLIISPAAMVCSRVEETEDAYRCYFDNITGEGAQIYNSFTIGDLAKSQEFNANVTRFYWRLVTGVGDDYIDLSKTDCAEGSTAPQPGDNIVQLGNREDATRQAAILLSSSGTDAPSFVMYNGINSYDLTEKNIVGTVFNPETKEPQMYCYGPMFFGDRDIDAEGANYITYQQKEGDDRKKLHISADIKIGAGSSGLSNLEEWSDAQQSITDAAQNAQTALDKAQNAQDYIDNTLPDELKQINDRLDGVVENWFYSYSPTLENEPAATWIADGDEKNHVGDTFTNTQAYVDDETTPDAGKSWRWVYADGAYKWTPIADSDAVNALKKAAEAQDTADQKRRVFIVTPYTPYDVGDLWTQGTGGDIMRCIKARATGSYESTDWDKASKYTDDTTANDALQKVTDMDYLKQIFAAPTVDSEGAVLGKLLAVKDTAGNVVAGLNASDEGKDAEHGKLMVFAGAESVQNVSNANTRIYEDGYISSTLMNLEDGCKVGDISIQDGAMTTAPAGSPISTVISKNGILINSTKNNTTSNMIVGQCDFTMISIISGSGQYCYRPSDGEMIGIHLDISHDGEPGAAISISRGRIEGLRPKTEFFHGSSKTLTALDHTLLCYSESRQNIYLPASPEDGQCYEIWKYASGTMVISGNGKTINRMKYGNMSSLNIDSSFQGIIKLCWSSEDNKWWANIYTTA